MKKPVPIITYAYCLICKKFRVKIETGLNSYGCGKCGAIHNIIVTVTAQKRKRGKHDKTRRQSKR